MKKLALSLIGFYQKYITPYTKSSCKFYPTCSAYTKEAIVKYGFLKGFYLGFRRILRCHPWQENQIDPVK